MNMKKPKNKETTTKSSKKDKRRKGLLHLGLFGCLERILPSDPGTRMMSSTLVM